MFDQHKQITNTEYIAHMFLAGWCADAVGARLEFQTRKFKLKEARMAMRFQGECYTGVQPGQFTDDSEMELSLFAGLLSSTSPANNTSDFTTCPIEHIAQQYIKWKQSKPFDMGFTTQDALLNATNASDMIRNSRNYNMNSCDVFHILYPRPRI